eukprot:365554-Chlamydomonas_euryale.AAC.14
MHGGELWQPCRVVVLMVWKNQFDAGFRPKHGGKLWQPCRVVVLMVWTNQFDAGVRPKHRCVHVSSDPAGGGTEGTPAHAGDDDGLVLVLCCVWCDTWALPTWQGLAILQGTRKWSASCLCTSVPACTYPSQIEFQT